MEFYLQLPLTVEDELSALTDTVMVVPCPYRAEDDKFTPMLAYKDGRFVCTWCAHTIRLDDPEYDCTCRRCREKVKHRLQTISGEGYVL